MGLWDDIQGMVSGVGGIVDTASETYKKIKDFDTTPANTAVGTTPKPGAGTVNPNIKVSDFAFQPYYPLLIGGAVLLVIALVMKGK